MLKVPRPWNALKTGTEIDSLLVHRTHSRKRSFWGENKATSSHHFPPLSLRLCGIDWQGFQFQTPQSCQHQTSYASCLPHGPFVSTDTFLLLTTNITLLFWPPFVAQTAAHMGLMGLIPECFKSDTGAVVSEAPFFWTILHHPSRNAIKQTSNLPSASSCTIPPCCGFVAVTQTHKTRPLLTSATTEPRSQTCVNWARHSTWHQDTRAPELFHHCWH